MAAANNWSDLVNLCLKKEKKNLNDKDKDEDEDKDKNKDKDNDDNDNNDNDDDGKNRHSQKFIVTSTAKPVMKYLPTYRLEPKIPLNKEMCEKIIKTVMDRVFHNFTYSPKTSLNLCAHVSEEIKNRIKYHGYDRYRYVVVVTVGEKLYQGHCSMVNFLWDSDKDGYLSYVYDTPKFFAVATLYYLYYD